MTVTELITRLNQSQALLDRTSAANGSLVEIKNLLINLGTGLVKRTIQLTGNSNLNSVTSQLNTLIQNMPGESASNDTILQQLVQAKNTVVSERNDPSLGSAKSVALAKNTAAKTQYENAKVCCEAFSDMEALGAKVKAQQPTAQELEFLSLYRIQTDRYFLISTALEGGLKNYVTVTWQLYDWITIILEDPRYNIQLFDDKLPFALLPVRVETRFMTIKHVRDNLNFGTDTSVVRTDQQVSQADSVQQTAKLQTESAPHEGGTLQAAPAVEMVPDKDELWVRIYPDDIAIHTHEPLLSQIEIGAGKIYWEEVWRAGTSNTNMELGAWRVLCSGSSPRRAAWIAKQTTPTNINNRPASAVPAPSVLNPAIQFPAISPKPANWSQQPNTKVMPDRFVVRLYTSSTASREVLGSLIPDPLPVGLDPANSYGSYLNQSGAGLNMPPELRWLTEFEEAEKVGMGIRITLQNNEKNVGFHRILVLGFKQNIDAIAGGQLLEDLFNNHHYSAGLALVPQGTATNNTENKKSGYAGLEPGHEESFATERQADLFNTTSSHYLKPDGQRFAEALGINAAALKHVANTNTYDVKESMAMSRALWSATLGYYLKNLLTPAIVPSEIASTKSFFLDYVHGRGLIPAFRVRNQPYGVLPTTVYSRWKTTPYTFEDKLFTKILDPLKNIWLNNFVPQLSFVRPPYPAPQPNADDLLRNILGLNPSSIEFYQRLTAGSFLTSNLVNFMTAIGISPAQASTLDFSGLDVQLDNFYKAQGFDYPAIPRIFGMSFAAKYRYLNGPVIDTLNLSEKLPIQKIKNSNANPSANYIQWLQQSPLSNIRAEDFTNVGAPANQAPPQALLYLLLRHAWFLEHIESAHCLLTSEQLVSVDAWFNQEFIKISGEGGGSSEITDEQKVLLYGVVKSEVNHEYGVVIENTMRNLSSNPEYNPAEMTPAEFEAQLRAQAVPLINEDTSARYQDRLSVYNTEETQWAYLTKSYGGFTEGLSMENFLFEQRTSSNPCVQQLNDVSGALEILKNLPTARLERCLAEHLDTCAYRLDSWLNGLVLQRMKAQRDANPTGIYVGAYGIVEKPHPGSFKGIKVVNMSDTAGSSSWTRAIHRLGAKGLLQITLPGNNPVINSNLYVTNISAQNQQSTFIYLGNDASTRLIDDRASGNVVPEQRENSQNGGFILAPSLNHAVAAAILRAGYKAHENTGSAQEALSVTLTSARVRTAMYYLDGVRNGQMLGALLGYRFERGLHDHLHALTLYSYLFALREKYPLVTESVGANAAGTNADAQTNHVVDGLKLLQEFGNNTSAAWASGIPGISSGTGQDYLDLRGIILSVKDDLDAIGDLLLSESIYQVSRGNQVRAGSVLNALGAGQTIPEPEIIKTPRSSDTLMHRSIVQLKPATTATGNWTGNTHRAIAEPALNNWLGSQLPNPNDILINVGYAVKSGTSPNFVYTTQSANITLNDLGVQPIDLLAIFSSPGSDKQNDSSEFSRRVTYYVQKNLATHDDRPVTIDYRIRTSMASTQRTIFEMLPLINSLIQITGKSRAVEPEDFMVPGFADGIVAANPSGGSLNTTALFTRLSNAITSSNSSIGLLGLKNALDKTYSVTVNTVVTKSIARQAHELLYTNNTTPVNSGTATSALNALRTILQTAADFGVENAIPETASINFEDVKKALVSQADRVFAEIKKRYDLANARINATLPTDPKARFTELLEISQIVFNRSFRVFPDITLYNANDLTTALSFQSTLMTEAGPYAVEEWMYGVSRVRPRMGEYHKQMLLSESITDRAFTVQRVAQFPIINQAAGGLDRWVAAKLPLDYEIPADVLSLVIETDSATSAIITCGMVIDEWPEQIPHQNVTAGIAMQYDQPSNEAPQSILLATTPEIKSFWTWNDLMDSVKETIDMAMIRAVEPDMIETSGLAQVLPALVTQMSGGTDTSPSLDFGKNNIIYPPGTTSPVDIVQYPLNPLNLNNLDPNHSN